MKKYKTLAAALMVCVLAAGCGSKETITNEERFEFQGYPIRSVQKLTYWVTLNGNVPPECGSLGGTEFAKQLREQTGVEVEFIHPTQGQESTQLNILLTSKSLPDIIEFEWAYFPGGAANALQQGYITELNALVETCSPNYKQYLLKNPDVEKMVKTDDGKQYMYPFIREDRMLQVFNGPIVRRDWLDDLGLSIPETLEDWHTMLTLFRDKKGAQAPLSFASPMFVSYLNNGNFIGAFGILRGHYLEGEQVRYGAIQPAYQQFLELFAQWYREGLIDRNISNVEGKAVSVNVQNGRTGATIGFAGSDIGKWTQANPSMKFTAVPYPVLTRGEKPKFGQMDPKVSSSGAAAISSSCKNRELAARFLDYGYSEEGNRLYNFGREGVSYQLVDGYPRYTDEIMNNPELSLASALAKYTRANYYGPFVQSLEYMEQFYRLPEQKQAVEIWSNTDMDKNGLPPLGLSAEESSIVSGIMNNIDAYIDEYTMKVVMNLQDTQDFDAYVAQVQQYGIDQVVEIYQKAYQRYRMR